MVLTRKHWLVIGGTGTALVIVAIVGIAVGVTVGRQKPQERSLQQKAHDLLAQYPLIDGHNDWALVIRALFRNNITDRDLYNMTQYDRQNSTPSQTDITRLRKGQVGGQFWSIYTRCTHQGKDAVVSFLEQIDVMNRIIQKYSDVFQLATTANEIRQAFQAKRIASLLGIEGGQSIENTFSILRLFYQLGVRYMTLTHNCNTPWADQHQVDRINSTLVKNNGLTDFGKKIVLEMNRLGMLIDLSHVAKQTMLDVFNVSRSPVIFSHSSAWTLCNHSRNVQDDVLELVKNKRGLVMVAFTPSFITCNNQYFGTVGDVAMHINYVRNVAGIDSVGIGADFDGIDETPEGLEDVSTYPKVIEYLLSQGNWTDDDIAKLVGGNLLRVMEENEQMARSLQKTMSPLEDLIPLDDLKKFNMTQCRYLDMYASDS